MSTPIATIGRHRYGIGYTVIMADAAIIHVAEKTGAESIAAVINAAFAETQAQRDELLAALDLLVGWCDNNDPRQLMIAKRIARAAIARARGEAQP